MERRTRKQLDRDRRKRQPQQSQTTNDVAATDDDVDGDDAALHQLSKKPKKKSIHRNFYRFDG